MMNRHKHNKDKIVAIIGARSGSKSVKDKNIRHLNGQPLIFWIIQTAINTPEIDRVIVSTDSEEYATIARSCGAEVPFIRPEKISGDLSTDFEYVSHCLEYLESQEQLVPRVALRLMATVPSQKSKDLSQIIKNCLQSDEVDSSVIVAEARQTPQKALKIVQNSEGYERLVSYEDGTGLGVNPTARQRYDKAYFRANAIAFKPRVIRTTGTITGENIIPHVISASDVIDIDSELDFQFAEFQMQQNDKIARS